LKNGIGELSGRRQQTGGKRRRVKRMDIKHGSHNDQAVSYIAVVTFHFLFIP
jgi:hypothetical protein